MVNLIYLKHQVLMVIMMIEEYKITDLFDIFPGKGITAQEYVKGKTPYISESATDNGIRFFINKGQILKKLTLLDSTLSISSKTGRVFYHKNEVAIGQQTHGLKLKSNYPQDEDIYLFLVCVIEHQTIVKASFGYQLSKEKLPFVKIYIPSHNKVPLWNDMKEHIRKLKKEKMEIDIVSEPIMDKVNSNCEWKAFVLDELFNENELYSCSSIDKNKLPDKSFVNGEIPYVTRTSNNNAVSGFLNDAINYNFEKGNCITIGLDTQTINYQPYNFVAGQNIQIIRKKNFNKYIYLFLVTIIGNSISKFSWGSNGATLTRLARLKIMLPTDDRGNPNWIYMEKYIKSLEFSKMI